jgi:hypothetical protein
VKFTIEIYAMVDGGAETRVHRTTVSAITPLGARKEARRLLAEWKRRGANGARILNVLAETVFKIDE